MNIRDYIIPVCKSERNELLVNFEDSIKPTVEFLLEKKCKLALIKTRLKKETRLHLCRVPDESDVDLYKKHIDHEDKIVPISFAFAGFIRELEFGNPEIIWMKE